MNSTELIVPPNGSQNQTSSFAEIEKASQPSAGKVEDDPSSELLHSICREPKVRSFKPTGVAEGNI